MKTADLLADGFERVRETSYDALDGLSADELAHRVGPEANSIGWLIWHLTRVQDDHVSEVAEVEQVWTAQDWVGRFGLPFSADATGYAQTSDEVAEVRVDGSLLRDYLDAVLA